MADLVSGAALGAIVSELLKTVLDKIKKAYRCKENCEKLQSTLISVEPYVEKMVDRGDDTCQTWLEDLQGLLEEALPIIEKYCTLINRRRIGSALVYWKRARVNSLILDVHLRIEKKIGEANMPMLVLIQDVHAAVRTDKSPSGFVPRELPPKSKIVSFENDTFGKLKTLVRSSEGDGMGDPVTVGLRGAGGAGKTLLAKLLHNDSDIQAQYGSNSIFWITVGHDAKLPSLYLTMAKFLRDGIFEREYASRNEEDQRTYLIKEFKKKKVLLILDDVWEQYSHGRSMIEWLNVAQGQGSVTLVTTRENVVLTTAKAKETVVVPFLSESEAWRLFCYHAFAADVPAKIADIAKKICKECRGLPLALQVIGGTMYHAKELSQWESDLKRLKESKGAYTQWEEGLFRCLKFSYDKLDDVEKKCFLYFAAFPEDAEIRTDQLYSIWRAEQLFVDCNGDEEVTLISLADQSLIELSEDKRIAKIHDVLRDLAIRIIRESKPGDWAKECYFHPGKDLKTVPEFSSTIKRISLVGSTFQSLPDFFQVRQIQVMLLSDFHTRDVEGNTIPLNFPKSLFEGMSNLRYLDLSHTLLKNLPKSFKELKALTSLDLSYCEALKELPEGIKELKALTSLNLCGCHSLKELPEGIKELKALTSLDLSRCSSLKELPKGIKELKALTSLDISYCKALRELPEGIKELKALTSLDLRRCSSLEELPEGIKELKALTSLNLKGCISLKELPEGIKELKALTSLNLSGCSSLEELPEGMKELKALTSLDISYCEALKELPEGIKELKALTYLDISYCEAVKELPEGIKELKALTSLNLRGCYSLEELREGIKELKALTSLNLCGCKSLEELPEGIKELKALTSLDISYCQALKELPEGIKELKALTSLDISYCEALKELPEGIKELKALTSLDISYCKALKELPEGIKELKALTSLNLCGCEALKELPEGIKELKALTSLDISY